MPTSKISWSRSPSRNVSFWGEHPQCCVALQAVEETLVPAARFIFPSVWIHLPLSCCNLDLQLGHVR